MFIKHFVCYSLRYYDDDGTLKHHIVIIVIIIIIITQNAGESAVQKREKWLAQNKGEYKGFR